jgi:cob(I)alamin adenosyltransferase
MPYTRKGDSGLSATTLSSSIPKSEPIFHLLGSLDHLNAQIGIARLHTIHLATYDSHLEELQQDLFDLGAAINLQQQEVQFRISVRELESHIDTLDHQLPPLRNFILPGGHPAAAFLHLCRTETRNVERLFIDWQRANNHSLSDATPWLNRLSSYFFSLARFANHQHGIQDIIWKGR